MNRIAISLLERLMQHNKSNREKVLTFNETINFLQQNSKHELTSTVINKAFNSALLNRILLEDMMNVKRIVIKSKEKNIDDLVQEAKQELFNFFQKNIRGFFIEVVKQLPVNPNGLLSIVNTVQNCDAKEIFDKFSTKNSIFLTKLVGHIKYLIMHMKHMSTGSTSDDAIKHPDELTDIDEPKNTTWDTASSFDIDQGVRDFPFVWINGELKYGKNKQDLHQDLINAYMRENDIDSQGVDSPQRIRSAEDIPQLSDAVCAFGHAYKNCAFVEVLLNNPPVTTIINKLKQRFQKVYLYNHGENKLKRLAKKINP